MHSWANARFASTPRNLLCCAALSLIAGLCSAQAGARLGLLPQSWRDDQGRELKLGDLRGHRVILTMAYASCHYICPMTMDGLQRMQQALDVRGERANIIVVGYDPQNDKPSDWHHYRLSHRLDRDNWHFLSGSAQATEVLARQLGFGFWKYDEHVMHESRVIIFDADGALQTVLGSRTAHWPDVL
jgi:protein SCO1/2